MTSNIGAAHIEGFGSIDAIARAKSEIFSGVSKGGFGVINCDDAYAAQMMEAADGLSIRTFGFSENADVQPNAWIFSKNLLLQGLSRWRLWPDVCRWLLVLSHQQ